MDGTSIPRRPMRAALVAALLLAGACNFTIAGVASGNAARDAGGAPAGPTPGGDGATTADLARPADLALAVRDMTPPPSEVGDACTGSCGAGLTCMSWVPDGYCTRPCNDSGAVCPPGSSCVDIGDGSQYCLVNAGGNGKCMRPDLTCRDCGATVCGPSSFCDAC